MWTNNWTIKKKCDCCGNEYTTKSHISLYCSKKCGNVMYSRRRKAKAKKTSVQKAVNTQLTDYAAEARKAGMSYGRFVAMMELKQNDR